MNLQSQQFGIRHVPEGFGSDDYEEAEGDAYRMELPGGHVDYEKQDENIHIRWIESQRRGTGREMFSALQQRYPGHAFETSGFTDEGRAFNDRLGSPIADRDDY